MSPRFSPPRWLMTVLMGCLTLLLVFSLSRQELAGVPASAQVPPSFPAEEPVPTPTAAVRPTPAATVEPTPTVTARPIPEPTAPVPSEPTPEPEEAPVQEQEGPEQEPDWSLPVPLGEEADEEEWFSDAILIGDSRTEGLRIYSGITSSADFLTYTGLTARGVNEGAKVIRIGEEKHPVLDFLARESYGKIYIALGINELGRGAETFTQNFGQVIDKIRALQPEARIYIQSLLPVNEELCRSHGYYAANPTVDSFNEALSSLCQEKEVYRLGIPEELLDETGALSASLTADGVHLQKTGSALWLDYLLTHTGNEAQSIDTE